MSKSSEAVKAWRKASKEAAVAAMGGKCAVCGYSRCTDALDFHHVDATVKDFGLGGIRANCTSWSNIVAELKKCVVLCANCHRELHAGIVKLPSVLPLFDPAYEHWTRRMEPAKDSCPVCGKQKNVCNITCSKACAATRKGLINWADYDVVDMVQRQRLSYSEIARRIGLSNVAVRKRYLKLLGAQAV